MKCSISYSREEIIDATQQGGAILEKVINTVLQELCHCAAFINTVKSHVRARGGNTEDAEDLLQEGLSQLAISLLERKYKGNSSVENYAFGICKYKWMNVQQKRGIDTTEITESEKELEDETSIEAHLVSEEAKGFLWQIVDKISGRCPEFLKLWALGYTHREIGEKLQVTEKRSRKNTSSCRQRLRDYIINHPEFSQHIQYVQIFT